MESEVEIAVKGLKGVRAGGLSGMRAEYLKGWLRKSTRKKDLLREQWGLLLRLVQQTFRDVNSPAELAWATVVLILKGKGYYRGVGLVEVA